MKLYRVYELRFGMFILRFVDETRQDRLLEYTHRFFFNLVKVNFQDWVKV